MNRLGCGREGVSSHFDSHLVAQVKAMLENPGQLEQELKVVREVTGLVELTLQQARVAGGGVMGVLAMVLVAWCFGTAQGFRRFR